MSGSATCCGCRGGRGVAWHRRSCGLVPPGVLRAAWPGLRGLAGCGLRLGLGGAPVRCAPPPWRPAPRPISASPARRGRRGPSCRRCCGLAVAARRPGEIVGAAGRRRHRLALDQHAVGDGIAMRRTARRRRRAARRNCPASRSAAPPARPPAAPPICRRPAPAPPARPAAPPARAVAHVAAHFALDIMRELARAGLGEIDAVARAQPAHLAFIVGAVGRVFAGFVDEAVPHVDIVGAGALGARAKEIVEIDRVGGRVVPRIDGRPTQNTGTPLLLSAAIVSSMRWRIDFRPAVAAEFDDAVGPSCLAFGSGAMIACSGCRLALRALSRRLSCSVRPWPVLFGFLGEILFADVLRGR